MAKRIRNIIICILFWLLVLSGFCVRRYLEISKPGEYTVNNEGVRMKDAWYITDNNEKGGLIWCITDNRKVQVLYSVEDDIFLKGFYCERLSLMDNDSLAVVFSRKTEDDGVVNSEYCVGVFNEELSLISLSPVFRFPMELNLTGLDADEGNTYITAVSLNGQQAYVYSIVNDSLIAVSAKNNDEVDKWKKSEASLSEYIVQECVRPRYFVEAEYSDEVLNLRYDNSVPGYFTIDTAAKEAYENKNTDYNQVLKASGADVLIVVFAGVIGALVIVLLSVIFKERRRVVYAVAALEVFMLVICAGSVIVLQREYRRNAREEYIRYAQLDAGSIMDGYGMADLNDEGIYDSLDYEVLSERLRRRINEEGRIDDVMLVNSISGRVILSASGKNRGFLRDIFGASVMDMLQEVAGGDRYSIRDIKDDGEQMSILAVNLASAGQANMSLVYKSEGNSFFESLIAGLGGYLNLIIILFAAGSLVGGMFLLMQSADLLKLQNALGKLSKGSDTTIDKPAVVGRDMNYMWNSVMEICKNVANNNRIRFLTYEAYFRFAPKSIERILNRQSITEVHIGDLCEKEGAIACVRISGSNGNERANLDDRNVLMSIAEECREEFDGIFVSHDSDISQMRYLFVDDNPNSSAFATELSLKLKLEKRRSFRDSCIFLHYVPYAYGVAGDERQAAVYLSSDEYEALMKYIPWFSSMGLGVVATEALLEHESFKGESRFVGYIGLDENDPSKRIKVYQLMEAELPGVRNLRNAQKGRYEEALKHFFDKDYYIARSVFSEVLKFSPDDELSKWYLFECERCLNDDNPAGVFSGNLHL